MSVAIGVLFVIPAFSATVTATNSSFPYEIEFDVEKCNRICYAGHPNSTVLYKDGIAVTPETTFRIVSKDTTDAAQASVSELSISISVLYENDNLSGSHREAVKEYSAGDLNFQDDFRIMSDNAACNLEDRDKLFSDSLNGFEMTLYSKSRDAKKKTLYLYICSDDDYYDYLMNAQENGYSDEDDDEYEIEDSEG